MSWQERAASAYYGGEMDRYLEAAWRRYLDDQATPADLRALAEAGVGPCKWLRIVPAPEGRYEVIDERGRRIQDGILSLVWGTETQAYTLAEATALQAEYGGVVQEVAR